MAPRLVDFPWLPTVDQDWDPALRALGPDTPGLGATLQRLAGQRIDERRALRLGRAVARLAAAGADLAPLSPFRLGVVASHTMDFALDGLPAAALRHGVAVESVTAPYGQVMQSVLGEAAFVRSGGLDAVLIAVDHRWFGWTTASVSADQIGDALATMDTLITEGTRDGLTVLVQTLPMPPEPLYGSFDAVEDATRRGAIVAFNAGVRLRTTAGVVVLDVAGLAERVGTDLWFNPAPWLAWKTPFDPSVAPLYAEWLGRLIGAIRGKAAKCLVLDLDNTLWGGVVGDDGIDGLVLGEGHPRGEAHLALQRVALDLRRRGIFLAIASKNTDAVARAVFRDHPAMLLRVDHIAVFKASWGDKASALEEIAAALNIGLDALVFVDDNPAERALIRRELPAVRVLELPEDPGTYAWTLASCGAFEAVGVTAEDAARVDMQRADGERDKARGAARDMGSYLASLGMVAEFGPSGPHCRGRIAQLVNKSNQFNLTTRRYTEAEIAAMEGAAGVHTLQVGLRDRFGDLGLVAVVICHAEAAGPDAGAAAWAAAVADARAAAKVDGGAAAGPGATWRVDSWLMSCRVLGRRLEEATLAVLAEGLRRRGAARLLGEYRPTARNGMVADLYPRLGFAPAGSDGDATIWTLDLAHYPAPALPMALRVTGEGSAADGAASEEALATAGRTAGALAG